MKEQYFARFLSIIGRKRPEELLEVTDREYFYQFYPNIASLPDVEVIDLAFFGSLDNYAKNLKVQSQQELLQRLYDTCQSVVLSDIFHGEAKKTFYPLFNLFCYVDGLQKKGKLLKECEDVAFDVWNKYTARQILKSNCEKLFNVEQTDEKYIHAAGRLMEVWGFRTTDIDFLRFFVCQCRGANTNPSLNKSLYLWSEGKQTGKTTFARALAAVLNGDTLHSAGKYESTFSVENQYNSHDLPKACTSNCVILDEAMPKDTKKCYGLLKALITGNSVTYNPKYKQATIIQAKRNYIFTSNDNISEYIQDDKERRFYAINMRVKPKQIPTEDIYKIVLEFCQQCRQPEDKSVQEWYNEFDLIEGKERNNIEDIKVELITNADTLFFGYNVSVWVVAQKLYKSEPTSEQKKETKKAMDELFGDCVYPSNTRLYSTEKIKAKIASQWRDIYINGYLTTNTDPMESEDLDEDLF